jgi:hypothetical protein
VSEPKIRTKLLGDIAQYLDSGQRDRFFAEVNPVLREALLGPARSRPEWISMAFFAEAVRVADRIAGPGDLSTCWAIGLFVAKCEVGPVQSLAMKVLRPSMIISLAPGLYSTHFQDAGRVTSRAAGERALVVSFPDFPNPTRAQCLVIGGWMQGWLGLGPRREVRVEHTSCRCEGAAVCEYSVAWID